MLIVNIHLRLGRHPPRVTAEPADRQVTYDSDLGTLVLRFVSRSALTKLRRALTELDRRWNDDAPR